MSDISLTEEAEAINWYEQRMALEKDKSAREVMQDAQKEELGVGRGEVNGNSVIGYLLSVIQGRKIAEWKESSERGARTRSLGMGGKQTPNAQRPTSNPPTPATA